MAQVQFAAKIDTGFAITLEDGTPLSIALLTPTGEQIGFSSKVAADALFAAALEAYDKFWKGEGHLSAVVHK